MASRSHAEIGLLSFLMVLLGIPAFAKVTVQEVDGQGFIFLDKFVFGMTCGAPGDVYNDDGRPRDPTDFPCKMSIRVWPSRESARFRILFYDDQEGVWPAIYENGGYKSGLSCAEKSSKAKGGFLVNPAELQSNRMETYAINVLEHVRPRYWYIVLAACHDGGTVKARVETQWVNAGGWAKRQFSHDEQGLLQTYGICAFVSVFACLFYWLDWKKRHLQQDHPLYEISVWIMWAAIFFTFNMVAHAFHLYRYADNGQGFPALRAVGRIMGVFFDAGLTLILIAMAKRWKNWRPQEEEDRRFWNFGVAYIVLWTLAGWWHHNIQDPASTCLLYDNLPGMLIALLRLAALLWFWREVWQTLNYCPSEDVDFDPKLSTFTVAATLWLFSLVIYVVLGLIFAAHVRDKVVVALDVVTDQIAMLLLVCNFTAEHFDPGWQQRGGLYAGVKGDPLPHEEFPPTEEFEDDTCESVYVAEPLDSVQQGAAGAPYSISEEASGDIEVYPGTPQTSDGTELQQLH